jgi:hypothetical protein
MFTTACFALAVHAEARFTLPYVGGNLGLAKVQDPSGYSNSGSLNGYGGFYLVSNLSLELWTVYFMEISGFVNCANDTSGEWSSGVFDNPRGNPIDNHEISANTFTGYTGDCIVTLGVESSVLGTADPALHPSPHFSPG